MRVEERYKRVDHNTLELTVTVDDPKIYTKPFVVATTGTGGFRIRKTKNNCVCRRR